MSGVLTIPNQFANAVTATGAQLDADFNTVTAYINDPTNRNNYAADGGAATNTLTLTFSPPIVGGYSAGLEITFKATNTNTGAVVLNGNGLGNASLVNPDGSALQSGQLPAGAPAKAVYDGTNFVFLAPPSPVSQAQMETATASSGFVYPSAVQWHPGVAKAAAFLIGTATGTILPGAFMSSYGVTSVVRTGTGTYVITFAKGFSSTQFAFIHGGASAISAEATSGRSTNAVTLLTQSSSGTPSDSLFVNFAAYGDLP